MGEPTNFLIVILSSHLDSDRIDDEDEINMELETGKPEVVIYLFIYLTNK